jgi:hypothetical protein
MLMPRLIDTLPPVTDTQLARSIASWLRRVPARTLVELADSDSRDSAAAALAEMIAAEMTEAYPGLVELSAPPLPF